MALAQTLIVRFLTLGLNIVTGIIIARYLGPVGRAEQAAILLGVLLFPFLVSFGIPLAIQFKMRTEPDNATDQISTAIVLVTGLGFFAAGASYFVLPHMLDKYSPAILAAARLAMLTAPLAMLYALLCSIMQAQGRFREPNFTRWAMPASTIAILVALVFAHRMTPVSTATAYLASFFWAVPYLWEKVRPAFRFTNFRASTGALLSYGSRTYVSDILGTLAAQVDQVLVIGLLSPVSMGLYAVAIGAARSVDLFSSSVVTVLFPKMSSQDTKSIVELTGRAARVTGAMLIATTLFLILAMGVLLPFFYGHAFLAAVPVARLIVISIALNGVVYVLAQAYMSAGRPGVIATIQLVGLATTIPAMLVLIPRFGLIGAATALVISTSVRLCLALAGFPTILKSRVPSLILGRDDVAFVRQAVTRQTRK